MPPSYEHAYKTFDLKKNELEYWFKYIWKLEKWNFDFNIQGNLQMTTFHGRRKLEADSRDFSIAVNAH